MEKVRCLGKKGGNWEKLVFREAGEKNKKKKKNFPLFGGLKWPPKYFFPFFFF